MTKIVQLVNSCKECPNRHYYTAGTYECMKVQPSKLNADMSIPEWCPLTDYRCAVSQQFPYGRTFQSIAAATSSQVEGVAINVSVEAFIAEWNAYPARGVDSVDGGKTE